MTESSRQSGLNAIMLGVAFISLLQTGDGPQQPADSCTFFSVSFSQQSDTPRVPSLGISSLRTDLPASQKSKKSFSVLHKFPTPRYQDIRASQNTPGEWSVRDFQDKEYFGGKWMEIQVQVKEWYKISNW